MGFYVSTVRKGCYPDFGRSSNAEKEEPKGKRPPVGFGLYGGGESENEPQLTLTLSTLSLRQEREGTSVPFSYPYIAQCYPACMRAYIYIYTYARMQACTIRDTVQAFTSKM